MNNLRLVLFCCLILVLIMPACTKKDTHIPVITDHTKELAGVRLFLGTFSYGWFDKNTRTSFDTNYIATDSVPIYVVSDTAIYINSFPSPGYYLTLFSKDLHQLTFKGGVGPFSEVLTYDITSHTIHYVYSYSDPYSHDSKDLLSP